MNRIPVLASVLLLACVPAGSAFTISNSLIGFTAQIPAGFQSFPAGLQNPDALYCFMLGDTTDATPDIALLFERMRGTIGRDSIEEFATSKPGVSVFKERWRSFDLDVVCVREVLGPVSTITLNVQIPLRREAIQIRLVGEAHKDAELRELLKRVLKGIGGESNWLSTSQQWIRIAKAIGQMAFVAALIVWLLRRHRMRRRKATAA